MTQKKTTTTKISIAKRWFGIIFAIIAALSLLSMIASAFVFRTIFHRRTESPFDLRMEYSCSDESEYPRQSVKFISGNHCLSGNVYGLNTGSGIIIVVNGFNATMDSHLAEIFYFVDNGWIVFSFDGTGIGDSDGTNVVGLEQTRKDVLAAIDYITNDEQLSKEPIFLYGHSAGGYAVATLCDDYRISATVSISGFNSPCDIMKHYAKKYVGCLADISYPFLLAYDRFLFGEDGNITASEHIADTTKPVLIIQGSDDEVVPYEFSIYSACKSNQNCSLELLLIDDEYRNRHSTIWLTSDAAKEIVQYQAYSKGTDEESLSKEEMIILKDNATMSRTILRQIDCEFLENISSFFDNVLNN